MPAEPAGRAMNLGDLTAGDLADLVPEAVLVVPIGATEQHGPCMPLRTDSRLVEAVLSSAGSRLAQDRSGGPPIVVAPTQSYGHSQHHLFAGALSLRPTTLIAVLQDLIDSSYATGFRRVFIVNGHGGNDEGVRMAVKDGANRRDMLLGSCNYWSLADDRWSGRFPHIPGHAGAFETSLLRAVEPDLVRSDRFESAVPGPSGTHATSLAPGVTVARAGDWAGSGGFTDPPGNSDAELGAEYLEVLGTNLARVLDDFARLPLTLQQD